MKMKRNILKVVALAAVLSFGTSVLYAQKTDVVPDFEEQDNLNRDENDEIIRGAYLTNPWYDNWTIGVGGGVQTHFSSLNTQMISPLVSGYIIKWFTPVIAARFGYSGFNGREGYVDGYKYSPHTLGDHSYWASAYDPASNTLKFSRHKFHADIMWNVVNTIWGYKYNRVFTVSPYISGGYMRLSEGKFSDPQHDNEMYGGIGLYNAFRISNHLSIVLDINNDFYSGRYHWSEGGIVSNLGATIGISYTIHKWYWNRSRPIEKALDTAQSNAATEAEKAAKSAVEAANARKELAEANKEIESLKQVINAQPADVVYMTKEELEARALAAQQIIYYNINESEILPTEQKHLDAYVTNTLAKDPKHVFYLTGSADKGTGTEPINVRLSRERAEGVKATLMKKHNVPENQIIIKSTIVSDKHEDGSFDRCVLIENNPD